MQKNIQKTYFIKFVSLFFILSIFYSPCLFASPAGQRYLHVDGETFVYPRVCNTVGYTCSLRANGSIRYWCYTTLSERAYAIRNSYAGKQIRCMRRLPAQQVPNDTK